MISRTYFLLLLAAMSHQRSTTHAYITSHAAVPMNRQQQWLREMTSDIVKSPPGMLTEDMLRRTPQIMNAWSSSRRGGTESAMAVESLILRILEERRSGNDQAYATTEDYNCLLEGWAKSNAGMAGAERCEQIVAEMEERYSSLGDQMIQPNLQSFKAVLMAWKMSGAEFSAVRAQRVLEWMIRLASDGENVAVLPDADCFDIVLQLWSRSGLQDAPEKTEKLLIAMERLYLATHLEKLRPRTTSFNAALAAWCKSGDKEAMTRATDILHFMESRRASYAAPDEASYTTVVSALLKSRAPGMAQTAEALLKNAEASCKEGEAPDTILYNTVIGCWARSNRSGAYRKTRSILDRQISNYEDGCYKCKPDVYSFTSVIASCAMEPGNTKEMSKAFHVALAVFQQMSRYDSPSHVTYGTILKACARLLPDNQYLRHKWAKKLFRQSVRDGQVSDMVISRLRNAVSPPIFRDLMEGHNTDQLPEAWTANVVEKSDFRKQSNKKKGKAKRKAEV